MKKILLSLLFLVFVTTQITLAQSKEDKKIATKLCDCLDKTFKQYPPILSDYIINSSQVGEEKAQAMMMEKLLKLSPEEQEKFAKAVDGNNAPDKMMDKNCGEAKKYIDKSKSSETEDQKMNNVLKAMKNTKNCKLGYAVMLMGVNSKK